MTRRTHQYYEGNRSLSFLWNSVKDGVKSRYLPRSKDKDFQAQSNRVREYFSKFRYNENAVEIIDNASAPYRKFSDYCLKSTLVKAPTNKISLLEIGCGQATTLSWLKNNSEKWTDYTGLDLFISSSQREMEQHDERIEFIEGDIFESDATKCRSRHGTVIGVNSICYLESILQVDETALSFADTKTCDLLVVEPYPSVFWETRYNNIEVFLRYPGEVISSFERSQWRLEKEFRLNLFQLRGCPIWPISYGLLFKRKSRD